jgi:hypothetical protein
MNILEKRVHNDDVLNLISNLRFGKEPIELVGSASLRNQRYFSDYDFFSIVGKSQPKKAFDEIERILHKLSLNPNYYPIELKIQLNSGEKIKKFNPIELDFNEFKKVYKEIDFVKLDLVLYTDFHFVEVSVIYKLNSRKNLTLDEYKNELQMDIAILKKEQKYYKMLKRFFNLYRAENKKDKLIELIKFFNSESGKLYQYKSNIEAIKLMKEHYKNDKIVDQKIKVNLSKIRPLDITDYNDLNVAVNDKALKFIKEHNIKI